MISERFLAHPVFLPRKNQRSALLSSESLSRKPERGSLLAVVFGHLFPLVGGHFFSASLDVSQQETAQTWGGHSSGLPTRGFGHQTMDPGRQKIRQEDVIESIMPTHRSRVPLASGSSKKLSIDPAGFVGLGGNDVQATQFLDPVSQFNISPPPGHIGGDGDSAPESGLGDDASFVRKTSGV